jgi:prevent-host-death family protein
MNTVNALKIRNQFGEVLRTLEETGEPILVSKGREVRAVLISIKDFKTRFLDKMVEDEANKRFEQILAERQSRITEEDPTALLRNLRGYGD